MPDSEAATPKPEIVTLVVGACAANTYLVCPPAREDAFLVDAGDDAEEILRAVARSGRRLTDILLTHGHFDHILAAARLRRELGARLRIHALDAHMLARDRDALLGLTPAKEAFESIRPDMTYAEEEAFTVCGVRLVCLCTPGHTPGSVSLYASEAGVLFTGDTLFAEGFGRTDFPGGDEQTLFRSLQRLFALPGETAVYPGHGEARSLAQIARGYGL